MGEADHGHCYSGVACKQLPTEIARQVLEGGRQACQEAGISLAGGHSIDAPEPIFGLAVTGTVCSDRVLKILPQQKVVT